ncbi:hypothetical protein Tco_0291499 [Tanacetum coccineum]
MHDLCFSLRISLSKKRRLVAELDTLVLRGESAKPLEYMREVVARDFALLGDLEKLLAHSLVGVRCCISNVGTCVKLIEGVRIALQQSVGTFYVRYVELGVYAAVVIFSTVIHLYGTSWISVAN